MAIIDLFSKRKKDLNRSDADVFIYDEIPVPLRVQVQQILTSAVGLWSNNPRIYANSNEIWTFLRDSLCREHGRHYLDSQYNNHQVDFMNYLGSVETDYCLDAIELGFRVVETHIPTLPEHTRKEKGIKDNPEDAINELNYRFRRAGVGYQYADGAIFKADSEYAHEEIVRPALRVLNKPIFTAARKEFLLANEHFREAKYKDCIVSCNRSFESAMKAVCSHFDYSYNKGARATDLIKILKNNGFWPDYQVKSIEQLLGSLRALSDLRNNEGGHGSDNASTPVPEHFAKYAMHLCATNLILFESGI